MAEGTTGLDRPGIGPYPAACSYMGDRIPALQVPGIDLPRVEEEVWLPVPQRLGYIPEPHLYGIGYEGRRRSVKSADKPELFPLLEGLTG